MINVVLKIGELNSGILTQREDCQGKSFIWNSGPELGAPAYHTAPPSVVKGGQQQVWQRARFQY